MSVGDIHQEDVWAMRDYLNKSHGFSHKDLQDLAPSDVQTLYIAALWQEQAIMAEPASRGDDL